MVTYLRFVIIREGSRQRIERPAYYIVAGISCVDRDDKLAGVTLR